MVLDVLSFGGLAVLRRIRPRLLWSPDVAAFGAGYPGYLLAHDAVLGWPKPGSGPRPSPAFPDTGSSCVSLFGDSFTYGAEVGDDAAWGNVLAQRLGCRVANYGVGGYGTDQAFLRYRDRADEHAPIVILGIFEDNVQRNVNRLRELLAGSPEFSFKPRFKLGARDELVLLPLHLPDTSQARAFIESPERFLTDEYFVPGSPAGPVRPRLPFTLSLVRLLVHPDVRAVLTGHPYWERYYRPGHDSGALETTMGIVRAFRDETSRKGQRLLIVLFPSPKTMSKPDAARARPYQPLIDRIHTERIPIVDLSEGILVRLSGRTPCEIATQPGACRGHLNPEGNAWVAEIVSTALSREGWVKDRGAR